MELAFELFWTFLKIGLFAVGGGPATLPFLMELTQVPDPWYTMTELTNMVAVSESTPGPLGINMATYAGYMTMGVSGGIVATLGLVSTSIVIIIIVARYLRHVNDNPYVKALFSGLKPAVCALIAAAVTGLCRVSLFSEAGMRPLWGPIGVAVVVFALMYLPKLPKFHPAFWFLAGGVAGVILKL